GRYHEQRFVPDVEHKLDYGARYFYAPQSFRDHQGRRIVFGWVQEGRSREAQRAAGWSGVLSLPRELALGPDGHVRMRPVRELTALRAERIMCTSTAVPANQSVVLPEVAGDTLELVVELIPAGGGRGGLAVRRAPDGAAQPGIL